MNSHCHPASPTTPSIASSKPETGPPMTDDIGIATMNHAIIRVRYSAGKPGAEIERDAREEAGFGGAEQQAQRVEAVRPARRRPSPPTPTPSEIMIRDSQTRAPTR